MNAQDISVLIVFGIMLTGFIYVNFIFPKKVETEKKQKEENK